MTNSKCRCAESIGFKLPLLHLGKLSNDNHANFLTRNNKIFCPQLSRQKNFNIIFNSPIRCTWRDFQQVPNRAIYQKTSSLDEIFSKYPIGLFTKKSSLVNPVPPKRSIFQRHLKTTIIIIIHWQTTQTTQDFFSNYTNLDNPKSLFLSFPHFPISPSF